jgi:hypothetical protein
MGSLQRCKALVMLGLQSRGMQTFKSLVAQRCVGAALLTNVASCLHNDTTSAHFECEKKSLDVHLALIDQSQFVNDKCKKHVKA